MKRIASVTILIVILTALILDDGAVAWAASRDSESANINLHSDQDRSMDLLTFISSVVDALAWPILVLLVAYLLRRPIEGAFRSLESVRWRDWHFMFRKSIDEISDASDELSKEYVAGDRQVGGSAEKSDEQDSSQRAERERLMRLAELSPRSAVLESWIGVEMAAQRLLPGDFQKTGLNPLAIRVLKESGRLHEPAIRLLRSFRSLRNEAVHAPECAFTKETAMDFADTALTLQRYLELLGASG